MPRDRDMPRFDARIEPFEPVDPTAEPTGSEPCTTTPESQDFGIFRVGTVFRRSPRTGAVGTYRVLSTPDWVNIVGLTPDMDVVLVEQYRHGIDAPTLEIPGGMVDLGEDAAVAASRELREETGYTGAVPILLGQVHPNSAIQDNVCSTYLVSDCELTDEIELDPGEDILVHTVSLDRIPELLRRGHITHSLVIAAFHWLHLHRSS